MVWEHGQNSISLMGHVKIWGHTVRLGFMRPVLYLGPLHVKYGPYIYKSLVGFPDAHEA